MLAEYKGFKITTATDLRKVGAEIAGVKNNHDIAQLLQQRLHELADAELGSENPIRVLVCPECASKNLRIDRDDSPHFNSAVYFALCEDCDWGTARKVKNAT
jgi:hypothetical protein